MCSTPNAVILAMCTPYPPHAVRRALAQSYRRLCDRLGLTYLRWTNSISENAKPGYDTIVDTGQVRCALAGAFTRTGVLTLESREGVSSSTLVVTVR